MTAFFVILRQISTAFDIQCEKCCRKRLSNFNSTIFFDIKTMLCENCCRNLLSKKTVVENCCRKFLAKNVGKIYCRKKLSYTAFFYKFWQKILKILSNAVVFCQKMLSKKTVVEKKCCRILWFDTIFRRLFSIKKFVEKWGQKMLSKEADIICRKIPSKNIAEKYRQKMFVNKLTTKFVKLIF